MELTSSNPLLNFVVYPHALTEAEQKLPFWDQNDYRVKLTNDNNSFLSCVEWAAVENSQAGGGTIACRAGINLIIDKFTLFESNLSFEFENADNYLDGDGTRLQDNPYIEIGKCVIISN